MAPGYLMSICLNVSKAYHSKDTRLLAYAYFFLCRSWYMLTISSAARMSLTVIEAFLLYGSRFMATL